MEKINGYTQKYMINGGIDARKPEWMDGRPHK
jgi:hypothetical protein